MVSDPPNCLSTERLRLRAWRDEDAAALASLLGNWDVAQMTGAVPHPYPPQAAEAWIVLQRQFTRRGLVHQFAITLANEDSVIGGIGLFRRTAASPWEVGYWLGRPFWGLGYATEALLAVLKHAVEGLGLGVISAGHFADNPPSGRVLLKAGFRPTGEVRSLFSLARRGRGDSVEMVYEAPGTTANLATP